MSKLAKWFDEWRLALAGLKLAARSWKFWLVVLVFFVTFGTILNLLSSGFVALRLMGTVGLSGKIHILWDATLGLFGVGKNFWDWLLIFFVALLQGVLVGLVGLVWKKKRNNSSENLQNAGLVAGLAILGSGCPTCGTSLLAPIIGMVFSGGGYAIAGMVSGCVTVLAIIVALLTFKKIGEEAYVIMMSEKHKVRTESDGAK